MSSALYDKILELNKSLPIKITTEDAERNPQFLVLLGQLAEHLNHEGISKNLESQIEAKKNELYLERKKFLMNSILRHELQTLCIEQLSSKKLNSTPLEVWNAFQHLYNVVTLQESLTVGSPLSQEDKKLIYALGITKQNLQEHYEQSFPTNRVSIFIQEQLGNLISKSCIEKVKKLYNFYSPVEYQHLMTQFQSLSAKRISRPEEEEELYAHMAKDLVQQIIADKRKLQQEKQQLSIDVQKLDMEYWFLYRQMVSCIEIMEHLLEEYRLGRYKQIFEVQFQWLKEKVRTMVAKLQVLKLQYVCEAYDQETVVALNKMKYMLESKMAKIYNEVNMMEHKLIQYKSLGKDFLQLMEEYTKVLGKIQHNQQILERLT